ncbi:hypothetical protein HZZ13_35625 [Bradyrhizobium sp. CNPSo 4010]|uniref:Uncharacterized protein n=1 Tax=Bradyrhizobium agreste TaxID=2751811 RepID=A0ABS0Q0S7_9BRAD|nr:hypothetical protein [Bradyrhizobium agreste]MBH5403086.1 hypothetical protein [Bradyrhizobium agreste]
MFSVVDFRVTLAAVLLAGGTPAIAKSPTPRPDIEWRTSYTISNSACAA